jgi:hypothetical protein
MSSHRNSRRYHSLVPSRVAHQRSFLKFQHLYPATCGYDKDAVRSSIFVSQKGRITQPVPFTSAVLLGQQIQLWYFILFFESDM